MLYMLYGGQEKAAYRKASSEQRENGITVRVTPFQRTYLTEIQEPLWGTFLTEDALNGGSLFELKLLNSEGIQLFYQSLCLGVQGIGAVADGIHQSGKLFGAGCDLL